jgi:zinc protease
VKSLFIAIAAAVLMVNFMGTSEAVTLAESAKGKPLVEYETVKLDNGFSSYLVRRGHLPMVSCELRIAAGSLFDTKGSEGLASLTARAIRQGSLSLDAEKIDSLLDSKAAALSVSTANDYVSFNLTCLSDDFPEMLGLLSDLILNPAFDEDEFNRTRDEWVARIKRSYGNGGNLVRDAFYAALFPHSAYGTPTDGYPSTIANLTATDARSFYSRLYKPARAQLTVVGDLDAETLLSLSHDAFGGWAYGTVEPLRLNDTPGEPGIVVIVDTPATQATARIGHAALSIRHPDYFKLRFVNEVLGGGGLTSRLGDAVRNQRGLAYSVFSWTPGFRESGSFFATFSTKVESAREAVDVTLSEIRLLIADGPTGEEIELAKSGTLGRLFFGLETYGGAAGVVAEATFSGLGAEYLDRMVEDTANMNREEFMRVAKEYLHPDSLVIALAGPADKLAPQFEDMNVSIENIPE